MKIFAALCLLAMTGGFVAAQTGGSILPPDNINAQRAVIAAERDRLESGFLAEDAACYKKFAVNSCLAKINARRREAMAELRRQEIFLNDEERRVKGEEQLSRTREKTSPEKQQEAAERRAKASADYQMRVEREKEKSKAPESGQSSEKTSRDARAERQAEQQKKAQARLEKQAAAAEEAENFNLRQKKAQERRAENEAEKLKRTKPPSKPLPLPQ